MNPLSDKVVSLLRTVVPVVWGSAIAWLLTVVALPAPVTGFLTNQTDVVVVVASRRLVCGVPLVGAEAACMVDAHRPRLQPDTHLRARGRPCGAQYHGDDWNDCHGTNPGHTDLRRAC